LRKDLESRVGIEEEIAKAQAKSSEAHARYVALVEKGKATQALQASAAEAAADKEVCEPPSAARGRSTRLLQQRRRPWCQASRR